MLDKLFTTVKDESDLRQKHANVMKRFKRRCGVCLRPARSVHEIIPRSQGKIALSEENMIPLCDTHHRYYQGPRQHYEFLRNKRIWALTIIRGTVPNEP